MVNWLLCFGRRSSIAVIWLRVVRYGLVAMGPWLWIGCCLVGRYESVAVVLSLWVGCCRSVLLGRSLRVSCYELVACRLLWVPLCATGQVKFAQLLHCRESRPSKVERI